MYTKYGVVAKRVYEIENERITGLVVKQGFLGRLLNNGNIIFSTPGQYAG